MLRDTPHKVLDRAGQPPPGARYEGEGVHQRRLEADRVESAIRVTVLMPGRVETRLYDAIFDGHAGASAALYDDFEAVQPADIAAVICAALDLPRRVDLTAIEVLPTRQVFGGSNIAKGRGGPG